MSTEEKVVVNHGCGKHEARPHLHAKNDYKEHTKTSPDKTA